MRFIFLALIVVGGCGTDGGATQADAEIPSDTATAPAAPRVMVTSPRANEAYYQAKAAQVTWLVIEAADPIVTCDVATTDGTTPVMLSMGIMTTVGHEIGIDWPLAAMAIGDYHVEVTCRDASELAGTGASDPFSVTGPPQPVSYATQIRPMLEASCAAGTMCHDATMPAAMLDLSATATATTMVGKLSRQCLATALVVPGAPEESYLVHKLQGSGPCFPRGRMPRTGMALAPDQIQLVRDWIANGMPDN